MLPRGPRPALAGQRRLPQRGLRWTSWPGGLPRRATLRLVRGHDVGGCWRPPLYTAALPVTPRLRPMGQCGNDDEIRVRYRWRGLLPGQGDRRRLPRRDPRIARPQSHPPQARSVHQRRSRDDVAVPARRGVRDRGRRGDGPRPRALRALHLRQDAEGEQLHDRTDLRVRDQEGAARRVPRQDGAGDPARHQRDPGIHRARREGRVGRQDRRRDRGDRRHGRRHRVAAVRGSRAADEPPAGPRLVLLRAPDAGAVHPDGGRAQDQADAAQRAEAARDRDLAGRPAVPRGSSDPRGGAREDLALLQRADERRDLGVGRGLDLQGPGHAAPAGHGRDRLLHARHGVAPGGSLGVGQAGRRAGESAARSADRHDRQVRRPVRLVQVAQRSAAARRHPLADEGGHRVHRLGADRARRHRRARAPRRDPGPWRLRQARHRGQDGGDPLRPREQHSVPRHLPRHAARDDRVRAQRRRARRRQLHRVRSRHAAPGRRADHRVDGPHRPDRAARRDLRPRRHDAPRLAEVPGAAGHAGRAHLRPGGQRAAPPSLRGEQHLRPAARGAGLPRVGAHPDREPARDHGAADASVLHRRAVPPRVHVHAAHRPPAVQRVHPRRAVVPAGAPRRSGGRVRRLTGASARQSKARRPPQGRPARRSRVG